MKLLTNKKYEDVKEQSYMEGFNDADSINNALFEKFCADILSEIEELEKNTWDKERIQTIKEKLLIGRI
jgi:hypothetical protein